MPISDDITQSGEVLAIFTGSLIDTSSGIVLLASGSIESPEELTLSGISSLDPPSQESAGDTADIIKKNIENIDITETLLHTDSGTEMVVSPELKEAILDDYMDTTEKTKLSKDQIS